MQSLSYLKEVHSKMVELQRLVLNQRNNNRKRDTDGDDGNTLSGNEHWKLKAALNKIEKLEETFEKFDKEVISEGLLNIPPNENNSDPLTKNITTDIFYIHTGVFLFRGGEKEIDEV